MNITSRKLWLAIILILTYIISAFVGFGDEIMKVSPAVMTIFGTYVIGNVGSKIANKK